MKKILLATLFSLFPFSLNALDPETSTQITESKVVISGAASVEETINAYVGISECEALIENDENVGGTFTAAFDPATESEQIDDYYYFSQVRNLTTKIDCATGELCTTIDTDEVTITGSEIAISIPFSDLIGVESTDACTAFDNEFFIRLTTKNESDTISANDVRFIVDTIRPPAPTGLAATATEGTINIEFIPGADLTDVDEFTLYYSTEPLVAGELAPSSATKSTIDKDETSATVNVALDAGESLYVGIASNDEADNRSVLSNVVETSVVETEDFWEAYKGAGGKEEGCASTKGNHSWLLIFIGLIFLSRRKQKISIKKKTKLVSLITISFILFISTTAFAETSIWGSFEVKAGGILPAIDDEFGESGPYASTFSDDSVFVAELEFDAHLIVNPALLVGVGFHWGYGSVTGPAKAPSGATTEDTTSLSLMPLRLSAVARLTYLVTEFNIPFVPSLKLGVDAYRWSIDDPTGETATVNDLSASGWKPGWHASAGLHFLLNFLAPGMASNFDFQWGINRSYIFAEYMVTTIDGFGEEGFDFSDNYWNFGLAFDF